ncbi:unnamed protein product, partial [Allacma fusca]
DHQTYIRNNWPFEERKVCGVLSST